MKPCTYCGNLDCASREAHAEYARRTAANDRAAFRHFNPHLVGKVAERLGNLVNYDSISGREKQRRTA